MHEEQICTDVYLKMFLIKAAQLNDNRLLCGRIRSSVALFTCIGIYYINIG